jgi:hypothetical protein
VSSDLSTSVRDGETASRLLDVVNEAELEEFLDRLITESTRARRGNIPTETRGVLADALKKTATRTVPTLNIALGAEPASGAYRSTAAVGAAAVRAYGLELEGLSAEDRDYEIARQFVRFAQAAARFANRPGPVPAESSVDVALAAAAREFAPGLIPPGKAMLANPPAGPWVRRGNTIVLTGL